MGNFNSPDSVTYPTTSAVNSRITDIMNTINNVKNTALGYPNYGLIAISSSSFTAPSNCFVILITNNGHESLVKVNNKDTKIGTIDGYYAWGVNSITLFLKKGDVLTFTKNTSSGFKDGYYCNLR